MSHDTGKKSSRRLRRFYVKQPLTHAGGEVRLDEAETHHLRDLIRLLPGDHCLLTDGRGWEAEAEVLRTAPGAAATLGILKITRKAETKTNKVLLRVMPALLQKGKTDILMEKAQELGVDEVWPVTSDRCEVRIAAEKVAKTVERWRRIAVEAGKQSGCLTSVRISEPISFKKAIESLANEDALVIFHPGLDSVPFAEWIGEFRGLAGKISSLNFLIGPEGGFTEDEIGWVKWTGKKKNVWVVGLGGNVLRADTAFIGTLAALRFSGVLGS